MTSLSSRGVGLKGGATTRSRGVQLNSGPVRPAPVSARPVCRPLLLAPRPQTPRRPQRARLVAINFKQSDEYHEEAPVVRPKPVRHPLTEDAFAGASPAETATQEVLFSAGPSAAAAAAPPPQDRGFMDSVTQAAGRMAHLLKRPRALLRALVRNSAAYGLPLIVAYFARQPLLNFWAFYSASLDSHPIITKIATGVVGTILGDYVAQRLSHHMEELAARQRGEAASAFTFDLMRTSRLVIYSVVVGTPIGHAWFQFLDTHVMPEAMTSMPAVLTKMSLDQLFMSPLATALFFVVMRCWEGHPNDALAYMRGKMVPTLKANYVLWPLAHIVNFTFVPPAQRILYCNAVGVIWTVILSTILNARVPPAAAAGQAGGDVGGAGSPSTGGGMGTGAGGGSHLYPQPVPLGPMELDRGLAMQTPTGTYSGGGGGFAAEQSQALNGLSGAGQPSSVAYMRRAQQSAHSHEA